MFFIPVRVLVPLDEGEPRGDALLVVGVVPAEEADEHALLDHHALGEELPRDEGVGQAADLKKMVGFNPLKGIHATYWTRGLPGCIG